VFKDIKGFYPTPRSLINKMIKGIYFNTIKTILEPSAGAGHILELLENEKKYYKHLNIDCIEINPELQLILKGKNYRLVHDDFLTYNSMKKYDIIIMNPPFLDGDKHILKALQMQEDGGTIVCILNAETLKNPFSNTRKDLVRKLKEHNAEIEYIENAFVDADRKTGVEIDL
jgi:type I restriction-modification system DNA methylase subunit